MPSRPVQALLAVEPGVDAEDVKDSLPGGGEDFQIVGVVTGADEALTWLRGGVADLLLVACAGYSDRHVWRARSPGRVRWAGSEAPRTRSAVHPPCPQ